MDDKLVWSALEYEERERSQDWFWALGIIVVTGSIASIIFGNFSFAALLMLAGFLLGYFALKKPDVVSYELNDKGLVIRNRLYPYENIKSFWVQADLSRESRVKPLLFIHTSRAFMPIITVTINENIAREVHNIFSSAEIPEVEMKEHPAEKIMEILGF
jgi:hypothetical protein